MSTDQHRRKEALKLLAIHRQAKVDPETAAAYLVAVERYPADVLEQACHDLSYAERGEHEHSWPPLGSIAARCEAIMRYQREQREQARPKLTDGDTPLDLEKFKNFRADVQRNLEKKHSFR